MDTGQDRDDRLPRADVVDGDLFIETAQTTRAVVEAMVNASPWYDAELDDGWTTQLHRFRDRASGVIRRAVDPKG
ncbi:hypothetical protein [Lichenibacterium ramalinae]|uniref:hypothetical protein n=1 Tax=Lichenibacterium ramalinae TaxID=2316527 RepID=UPI00100F1676|nr:hypothetical protein [Lichenibacterium ramalinae]